MSANPSRINPIIATDSASGTIGGWIFNSLLDYDTNASVVPKLAKSYKFLSPTLLEFKLRDNVKWSDGKSFSAEDVLFTYETIISPKVFTPYASSFKHIKSVKIIDDKTIHVEYKYPFFKALETWMMGILPKHLLKNEKDLMTSSFNQKPIGTGPYILKNFTISSDITLHVNNEYFEGAPKLSKLIYHFLPDPTTEFMMLKSHQLDIGSLSPLQYEKQLDSKFTDFYNVYNQIYNN